MTLQPDDHLPLEDDPLWYKDAIIYELTVRGYYDSNGDGIGDFPGLTQKLDYVKDLGVTAIWLLPFYPSPLKDDGYDIADYTDVHPSYGTLRDVRNFIREAHNRGLRVITELVCNHTSDQHPWFQRARRAKRGSVARNYYVWSDTPDKYREARIIFKDFEHSNWAWDPLPEAYYWHRFYSHQPDLNYDSPQVRKSIFKVMDFWLQMGVDGMRLDAIPYLYEREGTSCENLPETHAFLKSLRRHVDEHFLNRMLLAEANQWPEQAVTYFGNGDECQMAFHFPLMPRLFMAIRMEDRFPIVDILAQTPPIPDNAQWALFLRNHDELTLEMVTDEERDYMYRVYAQDPEARINLGIRRRLAPLLGNNRRRIELMKGLLLSLPGTPVIYYGDEIGMGDNIFLGDRNGVRTPMQWSSDRNAGFSQANPQRLYLPVIVDPEYHYETVQVQAQQNNPYSLLWWMKRLIALRKRYKALSRGSFELLHPENRKIFVFLRTFEDEKVLVVANLSRFAQYAELDLSKYQGLIPTEMFGGVAFPPIGETPYILTLGPHSFYWFALEPQRAAAGGPREREAKPLVSTLVAAGPWESLFQERGRDALENVLPDYLQSRRWFGGKARHLKQARILDAIPIPNGGTTRYLTIVQVDYTEGDVENYLLPIAFLTGERADRLLQESPQSVIARLRLKYTGEQGLLCDALSDPEFCLSLLNSIGNRRRLKGAKGTLIALPERNFRQLRGARSEPLEASVLKAEQSNSSVVYDERFILKVFRRMETGINPELEMGRFLRDHGFTHIAPVAGSLLYQKSRGEPATVGVLQSFVRNEGNAWHYTLDNLGRYYEHALASQSVPEEVVRFVSSPPSAKTLLDLASQEPGHEVSALIGTYLESTRLLGRRTAEMHLALASDSENPDFAPEPFTTWYQRSLYQSMRVMTREVFLQLRSTMKELPENLEEEAMRLLSMEGDALKRFRRVAERKIDTQRIRIHGDYHLAQLLYTGSDFAIIDFEGEPARPISQRRIKRSPLQDVAGMLSSFRYAANTPILGQAEGTVVRVEDRPSMELWARYWYRWVGATFLKAYLDVAEGSPLLPQSRDDLQLLLDAFLLEKAIYELGYEMNNRPTWLPIPMHGVAHLMEAA